jgi:hypothetical protein
MKKNIDKFVGQPKLCQCRIEMGPILGQSFNWLCDDVMGKYKQVVHTEEFRKLAVEYHFVIKDILQEEET